MEIEKRQREEDDERVEERLKDGVEKFDGRTVKRKRRY